MRMLEGKVAIITGAAADIDEKGVGQTVKVIEDNHGEAVSVVADVSRTPNVQNILRMAIKKYEKVDILHNNIGILHAGLLHETSEETWDRTMAVNLKSYYLCSRHVIPEMVRNGGGVIINTASIAALVGWETLPAYCASKGAVYALTRAMAIDYAPYNIRVNYIAPGSIRTPMTQVFYGAQSDPIKAEKAVAEAPHEEAG